MCRRRCQNKYLRVYWSLRVFAIPRQKCPGNLFLSILECTVILFLYHCTKPAFFQALKALASKKKKPNVEPVAKKADSDSVSESSSGSDEEVGYSLTSHIYIVYYCLLLFTAKMWAISSDTHQLHARQYNHIKKR